MTGAPSSARTGPAPGAAAVGVEEQLAGGLIVDDPVAGVLGGGADHERIGIESAARQADEHAVILERDRVVRAGEVEDPVDVARAQSGGEGERVRPRAAVHRATARPAVENVRPGIADQIIVQAVAGQVDRIGQFPGDRRKPFDLLRVGQHEAHRAVDHVGAAAGRLERPVAGIVDQIGVVAFAADHGVGAGLAVELVGAGIADQMVGEVVAGQVERRGQLPGDRQQALDLGAVVEAVADRAVDDVGAFADMLDDDVAGMVDDVAVVAAAAAQRIGAGRAGQRVVHRPVGGRAGRIEDAGARRSAQRRRPGDVDVAVAEQGQLLDALAPGRIDVDEELAAGRGAGRIEDPGVDAGIVAVRRELGVGPGQREAARGQSDDPVGQVVTFRVAKL